MLSRYRSPRRMNPVRILAQKAMAHLRKTVKSGPTRRMLQAVGDSGNASKLPFVGDEPILRLKRTLHSIASILGIRAVTIASKPYSFNKICKSFCCVYHHSYNIRLKLCRCLRDRDEKERLSSSVPSPSWRSFEAGAAAIAQCRFQLCRREPRSGPIH